MLEQHQNTTLSANAVNMTGTSSNLIVNNAPHYWIIKTGDTNHMTYDKDLLNKDSVRKSAIPRQVHQPYGRTSIVTHRGTSNISTRSTLKDILHVPQFKYNLLSITILTILYFWPQNSYNIQLPFILTFAYFRISTMGR